MIRKGNINLKNSLRLVDTFKPAVEATNKGKAVVDIHFGSNMDILVLVAHEKQLSKDNLERIRILTESH